MILELLLQLNVLLKTQTQRSEGINIDGKYNHKKD